MKLLFKDSNFDYYESSHSTNKTKSQLDLYFEEPRFIENNM